MHPVEEYQDIIIFTVDRLNECEIVTPTRRRWTLNYYITHCTGNSISLGSEELEIRCWFEEHVPERLAHQAPSWAAQEKGKETRLWPIEWGSICCSSVRSPTPSHTHPFQIKREVYFSKELCRSSLLCRRYDYLCIYICFMWLYNTNKKLITNMIVGRSVGWLVGWFYGVSTSFESFCYIIAEGFFWYYHFSLVISYLSV